MKAITSLFTILPLSISNVFLSSYAFAGQGWYVEIINSSYLTMTILPISGGCWYNKDLTYPREVRIQPGQTKLLYTEEKNSKECFAKDKAFHFDLSGIGYVLRSEQTNGRVVPPFNWPYFERSIAQLHFPSNELTEIVQYKGTVFPWSTDYINENKRGNYDSVPDYHGKMVTPWPLLRIEAHPSGPRTVQACVYAKPQSSENGEGVVITCYK